MHNKFHHANLAQLVSFRHFYVRHSMAGCLSQGSVEGGAEYLIASMQLLDYSSDATVV